MTKTPITLTLSGAAGQIGYSLIFRVASGELYGPDTPVHVRMLEVPQALGVAEGVALELEDTASSVLASVEITADPNVAFDGANQAILVGARPRGPGMERSDLLEANGAIFAPQGRAAAEHGAEDLRVLVVGNPANTNALIFASNAGDIPAERITALTRLDHNRAVAQLAKRAGVNPAVVRRMTIWGNHSTTQYPDVRHATIDGRAALEVVDHEWAEGPFIEEVAKRGAVIIAARGASSVASTANAILEHVHLRNNGVPEGDWTSAARVSRGEYGVPAGLISSFPVRAVGGTWEIVEGLEIDAFSRAKIDASVAELEAEREAVRALGLI